MSPSSIKISASLLSADFARLGEEIQAVEEAGVEALHLDVMDGQFVPNLTFGPSVIAALRPCTRLCFDAHLMVKNPEALLKDLQQAGVDWVTVHPENDYHLYRTLERITSLGMKAGVALNPATGLDFLPYILPLLNHILIMTVNPGFGGQTFLSPLLDKITQVHTLLQGSPIQLQVDGGITPDTAVKVINRGADVLVAGTAIFKSPSYKEAVNLLRGSPL